MPDFNVSRRLFVGVVGSGVIAAPIVASTTATSANAAEPGAARVSSRDAIAQLLRPLAEGARFAKWTVAEIGSLVDGAVRVRVRSDEQHAFNLEILARDTSALAQTPPAVTEKFAIFVANGGDGWSPTREDEGLAAMTLAQIVQKNEAAVEIHGLLTHSERIRRHADVLVAPSPGLSG